MSKLTVFIQRLFGGSLIRRFVFKFEHLKYLLQGKLRSSLGHVYVTPILN